MTLRIQQIEALARRNLRGDYLIQFDAQATALYGVRDRAIRAAKRQGVEKYGYRRRHFNREVSEAETRLRTECRVAIAALFARLHQEQEGKRDVTCSEAG